MKLKTTTDACDASDACQEQLIRGGFKTTSNPRWLRLGGDKPGQVYDVWIPCGYHGDYFIEILKGTAGSKTNDWVGWDWSSEIRLRLV